VFVPPPPFSILDFISSQFFFPLGVVMVSPLSCPLFPTFFVPRAHPTFLSPFSCWFFHTCYRFPHEFSILTSLYPFSFPLQGLTAPIFRFFFLFTLPLLIVCVFFSFLFCRFLLFPLVLFYLFFFLSSPLFFLFSPFLLFSDFPVPTLS